VDSPVQYTLLNPFLEFFGCIILDNFTPLTPETPSAPPQQKRNISPFIAATLAIAIVVWIASGIFFPHKSDSITSSQENEIDKSHSQTVRATAMSAKPYTKTITLYGRTEPSRQLDLKAETNGKIIAIPLKEGSFTYKGDVILRLEKRDKILRVAEAEAAVVRAEITYSASKQLTSRGFQAEVKLAASRASLEEARARLILAKIDLENTEIRSPFDGILERINVEIGDLVGPGVRVGKGADSDGSTLATIIDRTPLIVAGHVAERDITAIYPGLEGTAQLLDGNTATGTIRYVSSLADPITRTFRVELEIPNDDRSLTAGATASFSLPTSTQMAYNISSSSLALNNEGSLGVKLINNGTLSTNKDIIEGQVAFYPVTIFDTGTDKMWVTSLPEDIYLITLGQAFTGEGQTVKGKLLTTPPISSQEKASIEYSDSESDLDNSPSPTPEENTHQEKL